MPEWPAVLDLLFFDERNPRSAMFQVGKVAKHVRLLPGTSPIDAVGAVDQLLDDARAREARQAPLFAGIRDTRHLPELTADVAGRVSDDLTRRYFSHTYDAPHSTVAR
jgi:uncharacterized alpha-E superfamily protein